MKNKKLLIALLALCAVNFAAHLVFYPALPETVPIHWGFDGQADGWGSKATILVMAALPAGMVLLMALIPKIDPHASNFEKFQHVYRIFLIALTVFLCGVSWLSELTVYDVLPAAGGSLVSALVLGGCGVLFVVLGNYMPRIKQNYTFGCRTPWALSDEHNWNRTQRMGGIVSWSSASRCCWRRCSPACWARAARWPCCWSRFLAAVYGSTYTRTWCFLAK